MRLDRYYPCSKKTQVTYENREEREWVYPRGVLYGAQRFLEAVGIAQPPKPSDFPQHVTMRNSTLQIREWELRVASECPNEASPYMDGEREDMRLLADDIKGHLVGRGAYIAMEQPAPSPMKGH